MTLPLTTVRNEIPFLFSRSDEVDIRQSHVILGSKPPTNEQVLLKFRLIHCFNQENLKGQLSSSKKDACKAAAKLVESWWKKKVGTDITIKSLSSLLDMVIKLEAEWAKLFKFRWKTTSEQVVLRDNFKAKLAQTFWAVSPVYEAKIVNSQDALSVNNREWLKNMKRPDREGALGAKDKSFTDKMNRKAKKRVYSQTSSFSTANVDYLDLNEDEDLSNSKPKPKLDPNFVSPSQQPKMKRDKSILNNPSLCLIADKYKLSHRGLTEIVSAVSKSQGKDLEQPRKAEAKKPTASKPKAAAKGNKKKKITLESDSGSNFSGSGGNDDAINISSEEEAVAPKRSIARRGATKAKKYTFSDSDE